MNQGWTYPDRIQKAPAGLTVLDYYTQRYRHSSREEWAERILAGQILLEGQPVAPHTLLRVGQRLTYHRPPWEEPAVPLDFAILYADSDVWAIAKPSGLPVLPGGGFLQHTVLWQLQHRYPQNPLVPVHRLGRGTSGVLLLARSPLAKSYLSDLMRQSTAQTVQALPSLGEQTRLESDRADPESRVQGAGGPSPEDPLGLRKTYRALIGPCDLPDTFTLTTPIGPWPHPTLGTVYAATPEGKLAHSEGRILQRSPDRTLVEVTIRTGRPHQIRIHLAAAGFPLVGDPLYAPGGQPYPLLPNAEGKLPVPGDCGYWLHAYRLTFPHPRTGERLAIACEPPPLLAGSGLDAATPYP